MQGTTLLCHFCRTPALKFQMNRILARGTGTLGKLASSTPRHRIPEHKRDWGDNIYNTCPIDPMESTFQKILIANRGEIAVRVMKTARKMGIKTVAIYSTADSKSVHVEMADEAFCIGDPPAAQSYLCMDKVLDVVQRTGAQAVHPGYGFLSENATFVKKLEDLSVKFIGPPASAIYGMGDKLESKRLAQKAGVNIVPGFNGEIESDDHCLSIANSIGYPVMIKASAGGGGKGMRVAGNDKEALEGFRLSKSEAKASFGDDRILIEKYVENPRHIEIQVLCDSHGNGVYLNERECSIQRRNQKVIEEAPSPFVDPALRCAMGVQALELAKAIGYTSAGTVEFLVDESKNFYFLEMNTRLQVEHPITECITGVDIVQEMIRVAYGHQLKIRQEDVPLNGWALEMRVYAEDPTRNFGTPSTGRLFRYAEPHGEGIRCDSGVREGSEISVYYDPMICKLVSYGKDRNEAIERGKLALDSYVIQGLSHNIPLLRDILSEDSFVQGHTNTSYLPRVYPHGFTIPILSNSSYDLLQGVACVLESRRSRHLHHSVREWEYVALDENKSTSVLVKQDERSEFSVTINGIEFEVSNFDLSKSIVSLVMNGERYILQILGRVNGSTWRIGYQGAIYEFKLVTPLIHDFMKLMPASKTGESSKELISPMPGVVRSVCVKPGDKVFKGQEVCVIEAMKMQNKLVIGSDGIIARVNCKEGSTVSEEDLLIELE